MAKSYDSGQSDFKLQYLGFYREKDLIENFVTSSTSSGIDDGEEFSLMPGSGRTWNNGVWVNFVASGVSYSAKKLKLIFGEDIDSYKDITIDIVDYNHSGNGYTVVY